VHGTIDKYTMRVLKQSRLTTRILFWVTVTSMLMFSAVTTLTIMHARQRLYQSAQEEARKNVTRNIAAISNGLWNFDTAALNATLLGLTQSGSIVRAEVRDTQRQVAQIEGADKATNPESAWEVPIIGPDASKQIGTLKIYESYDEMRHIFARNIVTELVAELTKIAGLAALLFIIIYSLITRHLHTLAREVSSLKPGNALTHNTLQRSNSQRDELDTLVESINRFRSERAEAEARSVATQLEFARVARLTTMGEMAASIAHEINQPLAAIVTNGSAGLRWLKRQTPDLREVERALERVVSDGHRASRIIGSIRAMVKKKDPNKVLLDLNELIREVITLLQGEVNSRDVLVETELTSGLPLVLADRIQLQQVVLNLIINGIEPMVSVTDRIRLLRVRTEGDGLDGVLLRVEDAGRGIEPEKMDRVFDPFFTTKPEGMGMGLSICRSIIEAYGGRLWASRGAHYGTVFHVALPASAPITNG
jgi:C4-dicarboxylate-specific signal transduction histidine kinase